MSRLLEEQADQTYAVLVRHLDICPQCQVAGGNAVYMCCEGGIALHHWENAEYLANQDATGEFDIARPLIGRD